MTRNVRSRVIQETNYGVYIWVMPDGKPVMDEDGNYLCVAAKQHDLTKIEALKRVAHYWIKNMGVEPCGNAVFQAGRRMITDEEYEEQEMRARAGLVPDPYDVAAIKETATYAKKHG